jgi:hypothetical protein
LSLYDCCLDRKIFKKVMLLISFPWRVKMNKSLVLFLLFASITSAYAESAASDKSTPPMQKDGLIADVSDEHNINALIMEPIAVHPIVVEQTKTTAEQLAEAAYNAIASDKIPEKKPSQVAEAVKAIPDTLTKTPASVPVTQIGDTSSVATVAVPKTVSEKTSSMQAHTLALSSKTAISMNEENLTATSQPLDVVHAKPETPAAGSIAEAVTTATKKVALDKTLFEQIHTAAAAPENTGSTAAKSSASVATAVVSETIPEKIIAVASDKTSSMQAHTLALSSKTALSMNEENLTATSQPLDVTQAKPEKPAAGSIAEAVTTATKKVALDKTLFEQIHTAAAAPENTVATATKSTAPATVALDKPLFEQINKVMLPVPAKGIPVASADKTAEPKVVVEEKLAQASQPWHVAPVAVEQPRGKPAPGFVAAASDQPIPAAEPQIVAEIKADKTPHLLHAENVEPTKITLDESALQQANSVSAAAVLNPVAVSTTLAAQNTNSKVVRDEFFEKALPEQVNFAKAATEKGAIKLTPVILALTETAVPLKLIQNAQQPVHLAKAEVLKAVTKPAPGSLAAAVPGQLALDKTLLQQINTASVAPSKSSVKPAATAMLAENTPSPEIVLESGLRQNEPIKSISGLSKLPVVPVGHMTAVKAQPTETKPAPGSLSAHAVPLENMMADNVSSALAKATDAAPAFAGNEAAPRGVPTDLSSKTNLDKSLLNSITAPAMASGKVTDVSFAPALMLAMATPSNGAPADGATLLDQIPTAKVGSVLGTKKPNNFNTAMIERVTGFKGVFNSKDNVYKISVPRDDLNIVVNGVKLTSAMGLTSWITFKNTPEFTVVKGNLVLTEEQVNSVLFTAIENNLNVTELHGHYLWESPKVVFLHIEAQGDTKKLALAVNKVFAKIKETSQGNGDFPIAVIDTANSTLSPKRIEMILGAKGALTDGVYKIRVATMAKGSALIAADPTQGANASATFAGSDDEAVLDGDIAMQVSELQKVLFALHKAGISIVAINQRMINDKTRYVFLHYWGVGKTSELARGLRNALDASVSNS